MNVFPYWSSHSGLEQWYISCQNLLKESPPYSLDMADFTGHTHTHTHALVEKPSKTVSEVIFTSVTLNSLLELYAEVYIV